jgi:hypothetical protein
MMVAMAGMAMIVPMMVMASVIVPVMIVPVIVRMTVVMGMVVAVIVFRHAGSGENARPLGNPTRGFAPERALPRLRLAFNRGT